MLQKHFLKTLFKKKCSKNTAKNASEMVCVKYKKKCVLFFLIGYNKIEILFKIHTYQHPIKLTTYRTVNKEKENGHDKRNEARRIEARK